jgi:hypothetical protein
MAVAPSIPFSGSTSKGRRGILAALSLLLLVSVAPAQAGPQERDLFYVFMHVESPALIYSVSWEG